MKLYVSFLYLLRELEKLFFCLLCELQIFFIIGKKLGNLFLKCFSRVWSGFYELLLAERGGDGADEPDQEEDDGVSRQDQVLTQEND